MKKIFACLIAAAALFTGCDKSENEPEFKDGVYVGNVNVIFNGETVVNHDKEVSVVYDSDNSLTITFHFIQFVSAMPEITLYVPGISYVTSGKTIKFSGTGLLPYLGEKAYERYLVTGLDGTIKDGRMEFELNFGAYPTSFSGSLKK